MNEEINLYHDILCNKDYPFFIDKYINTDELQRLKYIGTFCGGDYTDICNIKYYYSRLDHSISVALMTWNFTKDKTETLLALFHDLGTPCFSHCIDYLLGDSQNQESSEKDIFEIIKNNKEIQKYLREDDVNLENIFNLDNYTILEQSKPHLCSDRLDGILSTNLIWLQTCTIEEIKQIYNSVGVLKNENNNNELGFLDLETANKFFKLVYNFSISLQKNDDKYMMKYISDALKQLVEKKIITLESLYFDKESNIVEKLEKNIDSWPIFTKSKDVAGTQLKPNCYYASEEAKKRFVMPLIKHEDKITRLNKVSDYCKTLESNYKNFNDFKYAYIENIKEI